MIYKDETIFLAKQMYLEGCSFNSIAKKIGGKCSATLVKHWSDRDGWKDTRLKIIETTSNSIVENAEENLISRVKQQGEAYKKMVEKGLNALKDETVTVDRVSEIVALIDVGIKGERQISSGLVSWKYIEEVVKIICEEVTDDETKRRIAKKLQRLTAELLSI